MSVGSVDLDGLRKNIEGGIPEVQTITMDQVNEQVRNGPEEEKKVSDGS